MQGYVIETGIPLPPPRKRMVPSPRGARTPWTKAIDALEVGQSVLTTEAKEHIAALQFVIRGVAQSKEFAIRKVPGEGWRVWRTA